MLSFSSRSKWQSWVGWWREGRAGGFCVSEGDRRPELEESGCVRSSAISRGALRGARWQRRERHLPPRIQRTASAQPFFRLHFLGSSAPIERGTVAGDKSCIHCTNRALKRQYTDSFFALCENWGGLYSPPLCRCLSTALFEASPIVPANVSYWPESVPAMFPGSKLRARECLKRGNRGLNAFCCIVVWPIKSKLRSAFMQTGNYVVTAAAIDRPVEKGDGVLASPSGLSNAEL